nr:hypothetical protein [Rhizobium tropici]
MARAHAARCKPFENFRICLARVDVAEKFSCGDIHAWADERVLVDISMHRDRFVAEGCCTDYLNASRQRSSLHLEEAIGGGLEPKAGISPPWTRMNQSVALNSVRHAYRRDTSASSNFNELLDAPHMDNIHVERAQSLSERSFGTRSQNGNFLSYIHPLNRHQLQRCCSVYDAWQMISLYERRDRSPPRGEHRLAWFEDNRTGLVVMWCSDHEISVAVHPEKLHPTENADSFVNRFRRFSHSACGTGQCSASGYEGNVLA